MSKAADSAPRVAVIIPAYNRADLLREALDSVLEQTYDDWETIVVDDASSDDTYEVAESYSRRDPRVKALKLDRNRGIAGARMEGIAAAGDGEFICLLDSDDYWRPEYLERSVAAYDEASAAGRKVGIVSSNTDLLTPEGITGETWHDVNGIVDPIDLDAMLRHNYLHARAILSRRAWDDAGGHFAPECRGSDDYDLWLRIMELGYEAIALPEPLVVYRDHPGADTHDHLARAEGVLACYRRSLARGRLNERQQRIAQAGITHWEALRKRELVYLAMVKRQPLEVVRTSISAVPDGVRAFAQGRSRWREWAGDLRRPRGNLRRAKAVVERSKPTAS
jgi:glycosyltransferase involved in cell wall biosynthesis